MRIIVEIKDVITNIMKLKNKDEKINIINSIINSIINLIRLLINKNVKKSQIVHNLNDQC